MGSKPRINKKVLTIALLITILSVYIVSTVSASTGLPAGYGYLRPIKADYIDTLEENSKWCEEPLNSQLEEALENDLTDTSGCEQVWVFSAEEYDTVREWCLNNSKGEATNTAFLDEFAENLE